MRIVWGCIIICMVFFTGITLGQGKVSSQPAAIEVSDGEMLEDSTAIIIEEKLHYEEMQGANDNGYLLDLANMLEKIFKQSHHFLSTIIYEVANAIIG